MGRAEVQQQEATFPSPQHVLCLAERAQTFVWLSHRYVSLHLSTPRFPHISLPGMSERRRRDRYPCDASFPIFAPDRGGDGKMWKKARCDIASRSGVVRDGYFHWRAKRTE